MSQYRYYYGPRVEVMSGEVHYWNDRLVVMGICEVWIRNVRIVGYRADPNDYIPVGTVGDLEVIEASVDGEIIRGLFYPGGEAKKGGYGVVIWPRIEEAGASVEVA